MHSTLYVNSALLAIHTFPAFGTFLADVFFIDFYPNSVYFEIVEQCLI